MLQANQDADMSLRTTLALAAVIILTTAVTASAAAKKQRVPRSGSQAQAVAPRNAPIVWHDTPFARIHFFSFASLNPSMIRFHSSVHVSFVMQ